MPSIRFCCRGWSWHHNVWVWVETSGFKADIKCMRPKVCSNCHINKYLSNLIPRLTIIQRSHYPRQDFYHLNTINYGMQVRWIRQTSLSISFSSEIRSMEGHTFLRLHRSHQILVLLCELSQFSCTDVSPQLDDALLNHMSYISQLGRLLMVFCHHDSCSRVDDSLMYGQV